MFYSFQDEKDRLEVKDERIGDGEFYIAIEDFLRYFDFVTLCHMTPDMGAEVNCV
jgi:hypothetical protein